jgi:hypothetical protein
MENNIEKNVVTLDMVDGPPTASEIRKFAQNTLLWIKLGIVIMVILVFLIGAAFRGETINVAPLEAAVKNFDSESWQILSILKEMKMTNYTNFTTTSKIPAPTGA